MVGDLDLRGAAARPGRSRVGLLRAHRRHDGVHRHRVADGRGPPDRGLLDRPRRARPSPPRRRTRGTGRTPPIPPGPWTTMPSRVGDAAEPRAQRYGVTPRREVEPAASSTPADLDHSRRSIAPGVPIGQLPTSGQLTCSLDLVGGGRRRRRSSRLPMRSATGSRVWRRRRVEIGHGSAASRRARLVPHAVQDQPGAGPAEPARCPTAATTAHQACGTAWTVLVSWRVGRRA